MENIINQATPIIVTALVAVLTIIVKNVTDIVATFIEVKKEEVLEKIESSKYGREFSIGQDVWNIVEEHFRINEYLEDVTKAKIEMFNEKLLEKCPYMTPEQINDLRQALAGATNKLKKSITE